MPIRSALQRRMTTFDRPAYAKCQMRLPICECFPVPDKMYIEPFEAQLQPCEPGQYWNVYCHQQARFRRRHRGAASPHFEHWPTRSSRSRLCSEVLGFQEAYSRSTFEIKASRGSSSNKIFWRTPAVFIMILEWQTAYQYIC